MKIIANYYKKQYNNNDLSIINYLAIFSIFFVCVLFYMLLTVRFDHVYSGKGTVKPNKEVVIKVQRDMYIKTPLNQVGNAYKKGDLIFTGYDKDDNLIYSFYAPFDLLIIMSRNGDFSDGFYFKNEQLFTIISTGENLLTVPIPSRWLGKINEGQDVKLKSIINGKLFLKHVNAINILNVNNQYKTIAIIDIGDINEFTVGQDVDVNIVSDSLSLIDYLIFSFN
ncbi:hypothetical protein [Photorhabdus laumondii]